MSKGYTVYTDASKYGWAGVLTQAHTSIVEGKKVTTDHPIAYVSGLFRGSQLNWAALTKEAFAIYMSVKKLSFYLTHADVLLKSDHLPLKKFLQKNTLNNKVNNWAMELKAYNIRFEHVSGKANILADTLSHLVDIDPDVRLDPENAGWEFRYYVFESLSKLSGEDIVQICKILSGENVIRPDPDIQQPFTQQLRSPLTLDQLHTLQALWHTVYRKVYYIIMSLRECNHSKLYTFLKHLKALSNQYSKLHMMNQVTMDFQGHIQPSEGCITGKESKKTYSNTAEIATHANYTGLLQ